jgi:hypothetical protein
VLKASHVGHITDHHLDVWQAGKLALGFRERAGERSDLPALLGQQAHEIVAKQPVEPVTKAFDGRHASPADGHPGYWPVCEKRDQIVKIPIGICIGMEN